MTADRCGAEVGRNGRGEGGGPCGRMAGHAGNCRSADSIAASGQRKRRVYADGKTELPAKPCRECGADFTPGRRDQEYCGVPCRNRRVNRDHRRAKRAEQLAVTPPKACEQCGTEFPATNVRKRYCSEICGERARMPEKLATRRERNKDFREQLAKSESKEAEALRAEYPDQWGAWYRNNNLDVSGYGLGVAEESS